MRPSLSGTVSSRISGLSSSLWLLHNDCTLSTGRRHFNVIQRGNDREVKSLFALLGFDKESEAHRIRRTREELRQGFLKEAMKLKDPQHNKEDAEKLAQLQKAYTLLSDERFRTQYAGHHYASPDASLNVLIDGGQVSANFNPEHQSFHFVDHVLSASSDPSSSSCSSSYSDAQRSFGDFSGPFRSATGISENATDARPYNAREEHTAVNGTNINFMLRVSFDESILGCTKTAIYEKNVTCSRCGGEGRQMLKNPRKCPQCRGRGSTHLPSATYHIERPCGYCSGDGHAPPPKCSTCRGTGVLTAQTVHVPIDVRPGTTTMTVRRFRGKGNDGVRGGTAGDLIVTLLVQEHRLFHRDGLDLHMVLPIPLSTALLGGVVSVPTLRGLQPLRVPPCVRNGQKIAMNGYGVELDNSYANIESHEQGKGDASSLHNLQKNQKNSPLCGHLYVHLLVVIPQKDELTGMQRNALEQFVELAVENETQETEQTPSALKQRFFQWLKNT
ncbi:chaperone DnaJ protein [Trypanosoma theileri]|uniref:Chaperone DnaJ protein n=1 Tax=Trypanosoma theileri TaxID=67003 RepID=A0A1X0NWP1_9TRYP|nr:chaperone DnaJ protein [Trypanosoma theileri]ORC89031.1 chaperone DnaJ protein [Trypanosoma theileri]